jgi:hypothetical protein
VLGPICAGGQDLRGDCAEDVRKQVEECFEEVRVYGAVQQLDGVPQLGDELELVLNTCEHAMSMPTWTNLLVEGYPRAGKLLMMTMKMHMQDFDSSCALWAFASSRACSANLSVVIMAVLVARERDSHRGEADTLCNHANLTREPVERYERGIYGNF